MATRRDGPNPLRPYYVPPLIGETPDVAQISQRHAPLARGPVLTNYNHKAGGVFTNVDYKGYMESSPSVLKSVKDVFDDLMWRYTSVLMAQPFEVAKTLLQVRTQDHLSTTISKPMDVPNDEAQIEYRSLVHNAFSEYDSDPDELSYFTSNLQTPSMSVYSTPRRQKISPVSRSPLSGSGSTDASNELNLQRADSILEVISQLWLKEGAWGVWKGANASFLYTVLQSLLENWSRSLLSAVLNVPDIGLKDDVDRLIDIASPYPWASLFVAAAAAVATGLILSPLDLVRTRLIITPASRRPRRVLSILRSLPYYGCPPVLAVPTILHSLIHPLLTLSMPLVLRTRFKIDKDTKPVTFSITKLCSSSLALFVKLPLETVLRRGQASVLSLPLYMHAIEPNYQPTAKNAERPLGLDAIVRVGLYKGVLGTMRHIVSEEGISNNNSLVLQEKLSSKKAKAKVSETGYHRGQGMRGLWRGWKVSWWGLIGLWTATAVGGGGDGEF